MFEITLWMKGIIFIVILIVGYFVLKYYEMDPVVEMWESITEMEWDPVVLVLTLLFSSIVLAFIWKSPMWTTPIEPYRFTDITGIPMKILLSILLPIIGYPLANKAWHR